MKNPQFIYNGYEYNDCGVCVNPDIPYEYGHLPYLQFRITVSQTSKGWVYGYRWCANSTGGGSGCSTSQSKTFPTKAEAIIACAEWLMKCFESHVGTASAIMELEDIITNERNPKFQSRQLTIFDVL